MASFPRRKAKTPPVSQVLATEAELEAENGAELAPETDAELAPKTSPTRRHDIETEWL